MTRLLVLLTCAALTGCGSKCTESAPPPKLALVVIADDGRWLVLHDAARGVTCWASHWADGGISCLPDSSLRQGVGK